MVELSSFCEGRVRAEPIGGRPSGSPATERDGGAPRPHPLFDRVVAPGQVAATAREAAVTLAGVDRNAHRATKLRIRERALEGVRAGVERIRSGATEW